MEQTTHKQYAWKFIVLAGVFLVVLFGSALLGRFNLTPHQLFSLLRSQFQAVEPCWPVGSENVLFEIRLPRIAAAALVGASLALAGVAYQGMFRNPMVSPDILGASTGAGFGAALANLCGGIFCHLGDVLFLWPRRRLRRVSCQPSEPDESHRCDDLGGHYGLVPVFRRDLLYEAGGRYAAAVARHHLLAHG